jgi:hypothetical protein
MRKTIIPLVFALCLILSGVAHAQTAATNKTEHKVAVAVQVNTSVGRSIGKPLGRVLIEVMEIITRQAGG